MTERLARAAGAVVVAVATDVTIVAIALLPFLNPVWVAFAQDRADAEAWTGYSTAELRTATDAILADLVVGPPTFDAAVAGQPVLSARERSHMADVRSVFGAFALLAVGSLAVLGLARVRTRGRPSGGAALWRAARRGAIGLAAGTIVVGLIGLFAFELAFETFHRLFFAAGTYTFDPRTDRLVQLFPLRFWSETSIAVGALIVVLSTAVVAAATRHLRAPRAASGTLPALGAAR